MGNLPDELRALVRSRLLMLAFLARTISDLADRLHPYDELGALSILLGMVLGCQALHFHH